MSDDQEVSHRDVERAAYRLLGRRDHARDELARKLRDRDFPDELIQEVLDDCIESGYVDDRRFAVDQGSMLARKCWGPHKIREKLRSRGVDAAIIDEALEELSEEIDWEERAFSRLTSRFGAPDRLDDSDQQTAYRHLLHRGFSPGLVRRILFDRRD